MGFRGEVFSFLLFLREKVSSGGGQPGGWGGKKKVADPEWFKRVKFFFQFHSHPPVHSHTFSTHVLHTAEKK